VRPVLFVIQFVKTHFAVELNLAVKHLTDSCGQLQTHLGFCLMLSRACMKASDKGYNKENGSGSLI
jgi:hypothetical protein